MNRIWFVTGAARGMGASIVNAALQQGDRVVATGRNMDKLRQIFSTVAAENIALLELDVRDERQQRSGRIINTSSIAGVKAVANATFYSASKFAVEGMTLALADEVAPLGIHVTAIEPGFFRTEFLSNSSARYGEKKIEDYADYGDARELLASADGQQQGDPAKLAQVVCQVVEMENPPRQLLIGNDAISFVMPSLEARIKEIREFAVLSNTTDFD